MASKDAKTKTQGPATVAQAQFIEKMKQENADGIPSWFSGDYNVAMSAIDWKTSPFICMCQAAIEWRMTEDIATKLIREQPMMWAEQSAMARLMLHRIVLARMVDGIEEKDKLRDPKKMAGIGQHVGGPVTPYEQSVTDAGRKVDIKLTTVFHPDPRTGKDAKEYAEFGGFMFVKDYDEHIKKLDQMIVGGMLRLTDVLMKSLALVVPDTKKPQKVRTIEINRYWGRYDFKLVATRHYTDIECTEAEEREAMAKQETKKAADAAAAAANKPPQAPAQLQQRTNKHKTKAKVEVVKTG